MSALPPTPHHCTAYCSETEHCDLVYISKPTHVRDIDAAYSLFRGLRVVRLEPAAEAPPLAAVAAEHRDPVMGDGTRGDYAYLVWWAER